MIGPLIERGRRVWQWVTGACAAALLRGNSFILIAMTGATVFLGIDLVALAVVSPTVSMLILLAGLVWLAVHRRRAGNADQLPAGTQPRTP